MRLYVHERAFTSLKPAFVPEKRRFVPEETKRQSYEALRQRRALNFTVASFSPFKTFTEIGAANSAAMS